MLAQFAQALLLYRVLTEVRRRNSTSSQSTIVQSALRVAS